MLRNVENMLGGFFNKANDIGYTIQNHLDNIATIVTNFYHRRPITTIAVSVAAFSVAGYGIIKAVGSVLPRTVELCNPEDPASKGRLSYGEVFNGAGQDHAICTVNAEELYAYEADDNDIVRAMDYDEQMEFDDENRGKRLQYTFNERHGLLIIGTEYEYNPRINDGVRVDIGAGRIEVNADVGENVSLRAYTPYETETEAYLSTCTRTVPSGNNNIRTETYPCTKYRQVFSHFTYPDERGAVIVNGDMAPSARISVSTGGAEVNGYACDDNIYTSRRPLTLNGRNNCVVN